MPHDINNQPLAEGDIVTMRMRVKDVQPGETLCNVTLVAFDGPDDEYKPTVACNTKLVERLGHESEIVDEFANKLRFRPQTSPKPPKGQAIFDSSTTA